MALAITLSGCGGDESTNVAKEFAMAMSSGNIKKAKELSTDRVHTQMREAEQLCNRAKGKLLAVETEKAYESIIEKKNVMEIQEEISKAIEEYRENGDSKMKDIETIMTEKYGNIIDIPKEGKEEAHRMIHEIVKPFAITLVDKIFDITKIETDDRENVKSALVNYVLLGEGFGMDDNIKRGKLLMASIRAVEANEEGITEECIQNFTDFGNIEEIKVVSSAESNNTSQVILELIKKESNPEKITIQTETVEKEWKVNHMRLKNRHF